jgi:hypothetical protein
MASLTRQFRDKLLPGAVIVLSSDITMYINKRNKLHLIKNDPDTPRGIFSTLNLQPEAINYPLMITGVHKKVHDPNGFVHDHIKLPVKYANNSTWLDVMVNERMVYVRVELVMNAFHRGDAEIM